jgi:hypothetical protein
MWLDQVFEFDVADDIVRHELDAEGLWHRRGPAASTRAMRRNASIAG